MTNNMDEFEHEELSAAETTGGRGGGARQNLADAWRSQPLFKLMVIMVVVGVAIAGALGVFSGSPPSDISHVPKAPDLDVPPGGKSSQAFNEQTEMANAARVDAAIKAGGSAIPTLIGTTGEIAGIGNHNKEDPMKEFRVEAEKFRKEMQAKQQETEKQIQIIRQQPVQRVEEEDNSLALAMQKQLQQLMESWAPRKMTVVAGMEPKEKEKESEKARREEIAINAAAAKQAAAVQIGENKILVQAGTVNYAQLLTEANSDVPGPILAQILSGPLAGGRAVGRFQVMRDYLVLTFNLVTLKGKEYQANIIALDPDTTLGAMATEVDHRYFDRVVLPAAASFASSFGSALSDTPATVVATNNATFVVQAEKGYKEALYEGLGQAGQTVSQFLQNEANQIKTLVRVAVGTPMGFFFLSSVKENSAQSGLESMAKMQGGLVPGYGALPAGYPGTAEGLSVVPGYGGAAAGYGQTSYPYGSSTTYPSSSYGTGYPSSYQQPIYPGSSVKVITPTQTGLGTSYYGR